jgi:hypothetical protein
VQITPGTRRRLTHLFQPAGPFRFRKRHGPGENAIFVVLRSLAEHSGGTPLIQQPAQFSRIDHNANTPARIGSDDY